MRIINCEVNLAQGELICPNTKLLPGWGVCTGDPSVHVPRLYLILGFFFLMNRHFLPCLFSNSSLLSTLLNISTARTVFEAMIYAIYLQENVLRLLVEAERLRDI